MLVCDSAACSVRADAGAACRAAATHMTSEQSALSGGEPQLPAQCLLLLGASRAICLQMVQSIGDPAVTTPTCTTHRCNARPYMLHSIAGRRVRMQLHECS